MSKELDQLEQYYLRGLKEGRERKTFLNMIREMDHLTNRAHVSAFCMGYILDASIPRVSISSAIGYTEKAIDRGLCSE